MVIDDADNPASAYLLNFFVVQNSLYGDFFQLGTEKLYFRFIIEVMDELMYNPDEKISKPNGG